MSRIAGAYDHRNMIGIDSDQVADIAGGPVRASRRHQRLGLIQKRSLTEAAS
jgi:hypothetical protein